MFVVRCFSLRIIYNFDGIQLMFSSASFQEEKAAAGSYEKVKQAVLHRKNSKQKEFEDTARRWEVEDDAMEAKCKVKFII